jgi:transcriptional regulator with XRE-family HTH domain
MNISKSKLGKAIRQIRLDLGMTQQRVADETGLTVNYLSLLENGKRGVGLESLNELASVFGVHAGLLLMAASDAPRSKDKDTNLLIRKIQELAYEAIRLHIAARREA